MTTSPRASADSVWRRLRYEYAGGLLGAACSFVALVILSQALSVEGFGAYQLLVTLMTYGAIALNLGLPSGMSRYIPEYAAAGQARAIRRLVLGAVLSVIGIGLVLGTALWLLRGAVAAALRQPLLSQYLGWVAVWMALRALAQVLEGSVDALRGQVAKNRLTAFLSVGQVALLLMVRREPSLLGWWFGVLIVSDLGLLTVLSALLRRSLQRLPMGAAELGRPGRRRITGYAVKEYANALLATLWDTRVDLLVVAALLGPTAAGLFGFAMAIMTSLGSWSPGTLLRAISRPLFVEAHLQGLERFNRVFQWYLLVSSLLIAPMFTGAALVYAPMVRAFFDPVYLQGATLIVLLAIGMMAKGWLDPLRNVLVATEQVGRLTAANAVAGTKLLVAWFLVQAWGLTGAGVTYAWYALGLTAWLTWWAAGRVGLQIPWRGLARIALNTGLMGLVVGSLAGRVDSPASLALLCAAGVAVYGLLTFLLPPLPVPSGSWRERAAALVRVLQPEERGPDVSFAAPSRPSDAPVVAAGERLG